MLYKSRNAQLGRFCLFCGTDQVRRHHHIFRPALLKWTGTPTQEELDELHSDELGSWICGSCYERFKFSFPETDNEIEALHLPSSKKAIVKSWIHNHQENIKNYNENVRRLIEKQRTCPICKKELTNISHVDPRRIDHDKPRTWDNCILICANPVCGDSLDSWLANKTETVADANTTITEYNKALKESILRIYSRYLMVNGKLRTFHGYNHNPYDFTSATEQGFGYYVALDHHYYDGDAKLRYNGCVTLDLDLDAIVSDFSERCKAERDSLVEVKKSITTSLLEFIENLTDVRFDNGSSAYTREHGGQIVFKTIDALNKYAIFHDGLIVPAEEDYTKTNTVK